MKPSLQELRDQIDAIDTHIHDLLIERTEIVRSVASLKGVPFGLGQIADDESSALATRPGREANVLRRLVERHDGEFPLPVLVHMWREIIAAKTHLQGGFSVRLLGSGLSADLRVAIWDLARFHFGAITRIEWVEDFEQSLDELPTATPGAIAVFPLLEDASECSDCNAWWWRLALANERAGTPLYVMSRLPFLKGCGIFFGPDAFAVSALAPEPSEDDNSLLVCFADGDAPANLPDKAAVITSADAPGDVQSDGTVLVRKAYLLDVPGFLAPGDDRIPKIAADNGLDPEDLHYIGAYARPIELAN